MNLQSPLYLYVLVSLGCALLLVIRHWRQGCGVGLVLGYVASFGSIHCLAPALNLLPWSPSTNLELVTLGTFQSTVAIVMFTIASEVTAAVMSRRAFLSEDGEKHTVSHFIVNLYLAAGFVLQVVLFPLARGISSIAALVATGSTLFVVGVGLKCWNAWLEGRISSMVGWMAASMVLPFVTVATQGFLGYGMAAMMTVFAFVAAFYGFRWRVVAAALLLAYVGLSVYVTYMRDRGEIREVVWSGGTLNERLDSVAATIGQFEWFDPNDVQHLRRIDIRLNQNHLIGAAVVHLGAGTTPFAAGATVMDAMLSVIPRALWPDKPMTAGSGDLVSTYTGMTFARDTSVGIGAVLEWYVNFGTAGVAIGFLLIGALLSFIDLSAFAALERGDASRFTLWFLPGLSLLQVGGSFVEVASTAAAGLIMGLALNFAAIHLGLAGSPELGDIDEDSADSLES